MKVYGDKKQVPNSPSRQTQHNYIPGASDEIPGDPGSGKKRPNKKRKKPQQQP